MVAVRNVVAPAAQPESASRSNGAMREVSFLRSASRCRHTCATWPTLLWGIWDQSRRAGFRVVVDSQLSL